MPSQCAGNDCSLAITFCIIFLLAGTSKKFLRIVTYFNYPPQYQAVVSILPVVSAVLCQHVAGKETHFPLKPSSLLGEHFNQEWRSNAKLSTS